MFGIDFGRARASFLFLTIRALKVGLRSLLRMTAVVFGSSFWALKTNFLTKEGSVILSFVVRF